MAPADAQLVIDIDFSFTLRVSMKQGLLARPDGQTCCRPVLVGERADLPIGSLAPRDMGDFGG